MVACMNRYHAHIYFGSKDLELARSLSERARATAFFDTVKLFEQPIGPHPTGMIETNFSEPSYNSAVEWIDSNRGTFSALIHHDTGDDIKDHTDNIRWLGQEHTLNFNFFKLIQERPELRINK